ncbi:hypothetical protein E2562_004342 [Oryza meyeriana var. granulata]|uniref:non-specific serine/threonine protein kinase n=1 Tax=Oryza meyeriana var. granulata TaxID=110450 RepID=A0A6G1BS03_9ORYZ|nr:hypothetical protein E2562_004342 [Oryza meyeriana var. granulata]
MAVTGYRLGLLLFCLGAILSLSLDRALVTGVSDTLKQGLNVTDGSTLVSADGSFTLGFFSPGVSTKRYLGIWFSVSNATVFWVANRDRPLNSTTGVLVLSNTGSLLLVDGSDQIAWSSNSTRPAPAVAQLLGSGNLVVREQISNAIIWQSFDYLSDTLLPGMKMGKNLWTGTEWYLSSWRSADDPSPAYRHATAVNALPDNVVWDADNVLVWRTGPWNGVRFSGITEAGTYKNMFTFHVTINSGEVTFGYTANPGAPLSRVVVTDAGVVRRLVWEPNRREWETFFQLPRDVCDEYAKCGPFGLCNANSPSTMFCGCVHGFSPASPAEWKLRETSGGCRRNVALDCGRVNGSTTDGFLVLQGIKLPVTFNASVDTGITVEECGARCLANCSCVAYAPADISGGRDGTGCIIWIGNLTDLRYVDGGQDLYVRLAKSELGT